MGSLCGYFLVGPTAVGKSAVAHRIAETENMALLSADSMLVYRGMDVGTAKPSAETRLRLAYAGIDLVSPDRLFSAWEYRLEARKALESNEQAGRRTIVVGGTGLYVKSLTHGLAPKPGADPAMREYWARRVDQEGVGVLQAAVKAAAPERFESLADKQNVRRLIRALEAAGAGAAAPARTWGREPNRVPLAGLRRPPDSLKRSIEARVEQMYRSGFLDEVRTLLERHAAFSATAGQAIGYAEAVDLLKGRCTEAQARERTVIRTRQLAKRQMTWFRHQLNVRWIDIEDGTALEEVSGMVMEHWRNYGPTDIP